MLLNIIIKKTHNFRWCDKEFDTPFRTVRFCGTGLGDNKRCSIYRHWGKEKCVKNKESV